MVFQIGTGRAPTVLLRADIDALPITEQTAKEFKSTHPGKMHACGHDGHTSMLLGAAAVLNSMDLDGTVKLIFQPAEEGGAGGLRMIEEGVLEDEPKVQAAFGIHLWPALPSGQVGSRPGVVLAACDRFEIQVREIKRETGEQRGNIILGR